MNAFFSKSISGNRISAHPALCRKIKNRKIIVVLAVTFALYGAVAQAQHTKKVLRIGYLSEFNPAIESSRSETIRRALRKLGWIEGQNIAIEYRYAEWKLDRLPEFAAELVGLKVDLIVGAGGFRTIRVVKNATNTIPIVMVGLGSDPVEAGLVDNLARPGGNVTGLTNVAGELGGKRLELLKEAVPKVARVAVFHSPTTRSNVVELKEILPMAARALRLTIEPREIRDADSFKKAFAALSMTPMGPFGITVRSQG